jgi:hypothetical protein
VDSIKSIAKQYMVSINEDPAFAVFKNKMKQLAQQMVCLFVN